MALFEKMATSGINWKMFAFSHFLISDYRLKQDVHVGRNNPRLRQSKEVDIREYKIHPKYDGIAFYHDVAIVILDQVK